MMAEKIAGVTTLTPSYNDKDKVFRLLDSLKKSDYPNLEIIVIDNGSLDGTLSDGKKIYPEVKWVDAGPMNVGQTGAYNLGFAHANPNNHILYIDSDVIVEKEMITKLVERARTGNNIGIVTPMILYLEDKNWVNQAGSSVDLWTGKVSIGWGPKESFLKPMKVQGSGTAMLITRKLIDTIGCLEDWFIGYLDPDYCVRALKAGFENWYEPEALCYHDQSKDPDIWKPRVLTRAWIMGRNRTLFIRKHGKSLSVYVFSLIPILSFYFVDAWRYKIIYRWVELLQGTIAGFFYPLDKRLRIPLPTLN